MKLMKNILTNGQIFVNIFYRQNFMLGLVLCYIRLDFLGNIYIPAIRYHIAGIYYPEMFAI